jgi:hypothetical protein
MPLMWLRWVVWLVFGLAIVSGRTKFDRGRYWGPYRIALIVGWLLLGYWFAMAK